MADLTRAELAHTEKILARARSAFASEAEALLNAVDSDYHLRALRDRVLDRAKRNVNAAASLTDEGRKLLSGDHPQLELEHESSIVGPPVVWEVNRQTGTRSLARDEIRALFGPRDEWDYFAPTRELATLLPDRAAQVRVAIKLALDQDLLYLQGRSGADHPRTEAEQGAAAVVSQAATSSKHKRDILYSWDGHLKKSVTLRAAQEYLGVKERQRQKLVADGVLITVGRGQKKRITVQSLLAYSDTDENPH